MITLPTSDTDDTGATSRTKRRDRQMILRLFLITLACMTVMSCGSANPFIPGDVNFDGSVDSTDAALVVTYILRGDSLSAAVFAAADMTGDSTISALDAALILKSAEEKAGE